MELTVQIPVTLSLKFLRGTSTLSGGLDFTALNYSHSIEPVEKIEWWTGICPPILPRGTYGERDVRANI